MKITILKKYNDDDTTDDIKNKLEQDVSHNKNSSPLKTSHNP